MKVTDQDVRYVADLAHLDLSDEERQHMLRDLDAILEYVDRLDQLDTSGVPPMAHVMQALENKQSEERLTSGMRDDVPFGLRPSLPHEEALANAPESDGTFFLVPRVIER